MVPNTAAFCCFASAVIVLSFLLEASSLAQALTPLNTFEHRSYIKTLNVRTPQRVGSEAMPNITLVTHLTKDRTTDLVRWCKLWRGPMSASLFLKPNQEREETIEAVWSDGCLKKHCSLHLVERKKENLDSDPNAAAGGNMYASYPFNVQRNAAISGATGDWVFLLDIDFHPFPAADAKERRVRARLAQLLQNGEELRHILGGIDPHGKVAYVVPAVETVSADVSSPRTFEELSQGLRAHEVVAFYGHHCRDCHHPTSVERFAQVHDQSYRIKYSEGYEPYVILNRAHAPPYDERFIGRGWSKMSFFFELNANEWRFVTMPGMFLVHSGRGDVPHTNSIDVSYQEAQHRNRVHAENFKAEVLQRVKEAQGAREETPTGGSSVDQSSDRMITKVIVSSPSGGTAADSEEAAATIIDWSLVASAIPGKSESCVSAVQDPKDPRAELLPAMIEEACSTEGVDCSPLGPTGIRNSSHVVYRADWAFDRAFQAKVAAGMDSGAACSFSGLGQIVRCPPVRQCCRAKPYATNKAMGGALAWVCSPQVLGQCTAIFNRYLPPSYHSLRNSMTLAMSFYAMLNSCLADVEVNCHFQGIGEPASCSHLFSPEDRTEPMGEEESRSQGEL